MGQRHQLYIKMVNPVTRAYDQDKPELRKIFGRGKHTILALHHQWLYGRSAIGIIRNILALTEPDTMSSNSPFNPEGFIFRVDDYNRTLMTLVTAQTNPDFPRGTGVEGMIFLNKEDIEYTRSLLLGDNNDGISIIDTIERKYCLMNIFDDKYSEDDGIYSLPSMTPVSALDYVNAYYPEDPDKSDRENEEMQKENIRVSEWLKDYEVLTLAEVKKISPKSFQKETV